MSGNVKQRPIVHDLSCIRPDLTVDARTGQMSIVAELVVFHPTARPSGTNVRLGMTAEDAMRLLSLLSAAQQQLGLPTPEMVSSVYVPAKKDQN